MIPLDNIKIGSRFVVTTAGARDGFHQMSNFTPVVHKDATYPKDDHVFYPNGTLPDGANRPVPVAEGLKLEAGMVITVYQLVYHCAKTAGEQKAYQCVHGTVIDPGNDALKATTGYFYLTYADVTRVELYIAPKIIVNIERNKTTIGKAALVDGKLVGYSDYLESGVQSQSTNDIPDHIWVSQTSHNLFVPPRDGNEATAYVDGADAMEAMAKAMIAAQESIYITGWFITPNIIMSEAGQSLTDILGEAARRGVAVSILLFIPQIDFLGLNPDSVEEVLETLEVPAPGKQIQVILTRPPTPLLRAEPWSHHQKTVVVDQKHAFLGGVDLAQGRRDTYKHRLDPLTTDRVNYYNPQIEGADREHDIRMPWHDVHVKLTGKAAVDVASNFVTRWNLVLAAEQWERQQAQQTQHKLLTVRQRHVLKHPPAERIELSNKIDTLTSGRCSVQIARSIQESSGRVAPGIERGIEEMYINLIQEAKNYIYIEQQYFSLCLKNDNKNVNKVISAISDRLVKAIMSSEPFRIYIVLPLYPEGRLDTYLVQEQMHWQYKTIIRSTDGSSLYERAMEAVRLLHPTMPPDQRMLEVDRYIKFFNLVRCEVVKEKTWYSQIYVHAKTMIVDDLYAVIGSANFTDRSLLGDRDTEIAALIVDNDQAESSMNGKPFQARKFALDLRKRLWQEHLGLLESSDSSLDNLIKDPMSDKLVEIATANTRLLENKFPGFPRDTFQKLSEQTEQEKLPVNDAQGASGMRGSLTLFPLYWLKEEDLETWWYPDAWISLNNSDDLEALKRRSESAIASDGPIIIA